MPKFVLCVSTWALMLFIVLMVSQTSWAKERFAISARIYAFSEADESRLLGDLPNYCFSGPADFSAIEVGGFGLPDIPKATQREWAERFYVQKLKSRTQPLDAQLVAERSLFGTEANFDFVETVPVNSETVPVGLKLAVQIEQKSDGYVLVTSRVRSRELQQVDGRPVLVSRRESDTLRLLPGDSYVVRIPFTPSTRAYLESRPWPEASLLRPVLEGRVVVAVVTIEPAKN